MSFRFKGVIFDLDGTLVDSRLNFSQICLDIGWPVGTPLLEQLGQLSCQHEAARASNIIRQHELAGAVAASWMPGAKELLFKLKQRGLPLAILTRNMRDATWLMCQRLQIPIELILTREDCAAKPDPEGLHQIAAQWQLPAKQLVYVGDYLFDLQVAANAGMASCLYLNHQNQHFLPQADYSFRHYDDFIPVLSEKVAL